MYDDITVKQNLPLPDEIKNLNFNWKETRFQTKDLENYLGEYCICEQGFLHERIVEREYVEFSPEEKAIRKAKKTFIPIWKDVIEKSSYHKRLENYHGSVNFYTYGVLNEKEDFWIEFKAFFSYGKLDKIELVEFRKDISRKITNKEWEQKYKERQQQPWNKFKRWASYIGWRWFWSKLSKACYCMSNGFSSIQVLIIRHML